MSLWSREHVGLTLAADAIMRVDGSAPCRRIPAGQTSGLALHKWLPALAALEHDLASHPLPTRCTLDWRIASVLLRYQIVPWHDDFASPDLHEKYALHCFAETYGEMARQWTCRVSQQAYGAAALACAIDTALLDRIDRISQSHVRQVFVQPMLMRSFNQAVAHIAEACFWFVLFEEHHCTLLLVQNQRMVLVKTLLATAGDLETILEREWAMRGLDTERCTVYASAPSSALFTEAAGILPRGTRLGAWPFINIDRVVPINAAPAQGAV